MAGGLSFFGTNLAIALEFRFWKLLVGGIGGLFGGAFPGGAGPLALLEHGEIETAGIEADLAITADVFDEVTRETECVVHSESSIPE